MVYLGLLAGATTNQKKTFVWMNAFFEGLGCFLIIFCIMLSFCLFVTSGYFHVYSLFKTWINCSCFGKHMYPMLKCVQLTSALNQ